MNFTTSNPRLAVLLSLLPVMLGRVRLFAALAGGAWLVGIELGVMARVGMVLIALVVIALDAVLTPPGALASPAFHTVAGGFRNKEAA
ncbi:MULTISPECIES: hypothetical protein [unclassified Streptomyces]|uniref:hypothetical protein n=1 Tax=unclassified Streptomyces TaxID=2593676 RepID=UPI0007463DF8|nr:MULTISPECIES: hypothetical protein [unclassified Streptomyces]KUL73962.1 hypothetical protein ADL34_19060 [Streptomyces sp. NRRL WC-3605]KUL74379.1 hypothetical protein ADL33_17975 [Streptomyces sp. NRRL WC-3604]